MSLYALNLLDLITTLCALSQGAVELNPVISAIIGVQPLLFMGVKLAALPLCLWLQDKPSYPWVTAVYGAVVCNNILIGVILW